MPSNHPSCPPHDIMSSGETQNGGQPTHIYHLQAFGSSLQVLILYANFTNLTKAAANTAVANQLCNNIHQVIITVILWGRRSELNGHPTKLHDLCKWMWTLVFTVGGSSVFVTSLLHCHLRCKTEGHTTVVIWNPCGLECAQHIPTGLLTQLSYSREFKPSFTEKHAITHLGFLHLIHVAAAFWLAHCKMWGDTVGHPGILV